MYVNKKRRWSYTGRFITVPYSSYLFSAAAPTCGLKLCYMAVLRVRKRKEEKLKEQEQKLREKLKEEAKNGTQPAG